MLPGSFAAVPAHRRARQRVCVLCLHPSTRGRRLDSRAGAERGASASATDMKASVVKLRDLGRDKNHLELEQDGSAGRRLEAMAMQLFGQHSIAAKPPTPTHQLLDLISNMRRYCRAKHSDSIIHIEKHSGTACRRHDYIIL